MTTPTQEEKLHILKDLIAQQKELIILLNERILMLETIKYEQSKTIEKLSNQHYMAVACK